MHFFRRGVRNFYILFDFYYYLFICDCLFLINVFLIFIYLLQSVTAVDQTDDVNSHWVVKGKSGRTCNRG